MMIAQQLSPALIENYVLPFLQPYEILNYYFQIMMTKLSPALIMNYVLPFFQPYEILYVANSFAKIGEQLQQVEQDPYYLEGTKAQDVILMSNGNILGTLKKVKLFFCYSKILHS